MPSKIWQDDKKNFYGKVDMKFWVFCRTGKGNILLEMFASLIQTWTPVCVNVEQQNLGSIFLYKGEIVQREIPDSTLD